MFEPARDVVSSRACAQWGHLAPVDVDQAVGPKLAAGLRPDQRFEAALGEDPTEEANPPRP